MNWISWEVAIKTVSEANCNEHWTKKAQRHRQQQLFTRLSFIANVKGFSLPCKVTLTRRSPRMLDTDNLVTAMKFIRDEVSECLIPEKKGVYRTRSGKFKALKGRADSDPRIEWEYRQLKAPFCSVGIELFFEESSLPVDTDRVETPPLLQGTA